jgi:hypothetical protein
MLSIILTLISRLNTDPVLAGQVEVLTLEAEAIYVPADWTGPVVALPLDEVVF